MFLNVLLLLSFRICFGIRDLVAFTIICQSSISQRVYPKAFIWLRGPREGPLLRVVWIVTCTTPGTPSMESLFWSPSVIGWDIGTRLPAFTLSLSLFFPCQPPTQIRLLGLPIKSLSSSPFPFLLPSFFSWWLGPVYWGWWLWLDPSFLSWLPPCPQIHTGPICDRAYRIWWSITAHEMPRMF